MPMIGYAGNYVYWRAFIKKSVPLDKNYLSDLYKKNTN